jgi:Fe-S-cluster-containing hydrogenase component 2
MQRLLHMEPGLCTGCLQCEMACSFEHEGEFNPARSRIRVFEFEHGRTSVPYTCSQCTEAWCLRVCPTGAIVFDQELGAKLVRTEACVGCKACTSACPFGTIEFNPATGKVYKCDLCGGAPQCVAACPTGAITYLDAGATGIGRMLESAAQTVNGASA